MGDTKINPERDGSNTLSKQGGGLPFKNTVFPDKNELDQVVVEQQEGGRGAKVSPDKKILDQNLQTPIKNKVDNGYGTKVSPDIEVSYVEVKKDSPLKSFARAFLNILPFSGKKTPDKNILNEEVELVKKEIGSGNKVSPVDSDNVDSDNNLKIDRSGLKPVVKKLFNSEEEEVDLLRKTKPNATKKTSHQGFGIDEKVDNVVDSDTAIIRSGLRGNKEVASNEEDLAVQQTSVDKIQEETKRPFSAGSRKPVKITLEEGVYSGTISDEGSSINNSGKFSFDDTNSYKSGDFPSNSTISSISNESYGDVKVNGDVKVKVIKKGNKKDDKKDDKKDSNNLNPIDVNIADSNDMSDGVKSTINPDSINPIFDDSVSPPKVDGSIRSVSNADPADYTDQESFDTRSEGNKDTFLNLNGDIQRNAGKGKTDTDIAQETYRSQSEVSDLTDEEYGSADGDKKNTSSIVKPIETTQVKSTYIKKTWEISNGESNSIQILNGIYENEEKIYTTIANILKFTAKKFEINDEEVKNIINVAAKDGGISYDYADKEKNIFKVRDKKELPSITGENIAFETVQKFSAALQNSFKLLGIFEDDEKFNDKIGLPSFRIPKGALNIFDSKKDLSNEEKVELLSTINKVKEVVKEMGQSK